MQRFWDKVQITPGCWIWTAARNPAGYGRFGIGGRGGRMEYAHRVAWWLEHGEWPDGHILHSCDNPPCVNVAHMRVGLDADNAKDRAERTTKAKCRNGHQRTPANTYIRKDGARYCLTCKNEKQAAAYYARKEAR